MYPIISLIFLLEKASLAEDALAVSRVSVGCLLLNKAASLAARHAILIMNGLAWIVGAGLSNKTAICSSRCLLLTFSLFKIKRSPVIFFYRSSKEP